MHPSTRTCGGGPGGGPVCELQWVPKRSQWPAPGEYIPLTELPKPKQTLQSASSEADCGRCHYYHQTSIFLKRKPHQKCILYVPRRKNRSPLMKHTSIRQTLAADCYWNWPSEDTCGGFLQEPSWLKKKQASAKQRHMQSGNEGHRNVVRLEIQILYSTKVCLLPCRTFICLVHKKRCILLC